MTDTEDSEHERPSLCESIFVTAPAPAGGTAERTFSRDDYVRCSHDVAGKYRIDPDYGDAVSVWLCAEHREEYAEQVVETLTVV